MDPTNRFPIPRPTLRSRRVASLAIVLGFGLACAFGQPAAAGVLVVSSEPEYLAGLVDRLSGRTMIAGAYIGTLAGVAVAIPSLESPFEEVVGDLRGLAAASGCSTVVAFMPGRALAGLALPGDLVLASRILPPFGRKAIAAEREILEKLRLAGADAAFFEVPDGRPGAKGGRGPHVLIAPIVSARRNAETDEIREAGIGSEAVAPDAFGGMVADGLASSGLRWAIVVTLLGAVGEPADPVLSERAIDNTSRLLLAYVKAMSATEPPRPATPATPRPMRGRIALRDAPNAASSVFGMFPRGTRYQVLESTEDEKWHRVHLEDGRIGWASSSSLEREPIVVYVLEREGWADVLAPRECDIDPHDATPGLIARAVCSPDNPRLLVPMGFRTVPLCGGIDSVSLDVDTVTVFFGSKARAVSSGGRPADWAGFLARLVYSLTEHERVRVVRTKFTSADSPLFPRAYHREDFLDYWPSSDLERAFATHGESAVRERAGALLAGRRAGRPVSPRVLDGER